MRYVHESDYCIQTPVHTCMVSASLFFSVCCVLCSVVVVLRCLCCLFGHSWYLFVSVCLFLSLFVFSYSRLMPFFLVCVVSWSLGRYYFSCRRRQRGAKHTTLHLLLILCICAYVHVCPQVCMFGINLPSNKRTTFT